MAEVLINYWSILSAAIASILVGYAWYSPLLFGNIWLRLSKLSVKKQDKKKMARQYIIMFISSLITAYVLSFFVRGLTLNNSIGVVFWLWLGFIATTTISGVLWENKPVKLYLINNGYSLVSLIIMAIIFSIL